MGPPVSETHSITLRIFQSLLNGVFSPMQQVSMIVGAKLYQHFTPVWSHQQHFVYREVSV